jgi:hypothetical protein
MAMARPPRTYEGRTTSGNPIFAATLRASSGVVAVPLGETFAIFGQIDRIRRRTDDLDTRLLQRQRQLQRRLPAVLHDTWDVRTGFPLAGDDGGHILEGQRLEVQAIDRVVVGGDRFRIAVDHDGLEPFFAKGKGRMATAIVELQPLADTVRPAAKDHDLLARRRIGFAFLLVRAVHVRREGLELGGAGIDPLVGGTQTCFDPGLAHGALVAAKDHAEVTIAEPRALERPQQVRRHAAQAY